MANLYFFFELFAIFRGHHPSCAIISYGIVRDVFYINCIFVNRLLIIVRTDNGFSFKNTCFVFNKQQLYTILYFRTSVDSSKLRLFKYSDKCYNFYGNILQFFFYVHTMLQGCYVEFFVTFDNLFPTVFSCSRNRD